MDIFDAPKRTKDDSIKKPMNFPQAEKTQKKLQEDHERQIKQFDIFLSNLYMRFDHKVNTCKYKCISKSTSYQEVGDCLQKCGDGAMKFGNYVNSRVSQMQQLLGDCVANANTLHNKMDEIYYCYQLYNHGYKKLKQFITEQSMFYQ